MVAGRKFTLVKGKTKFGGDWKKNQRDRNRLNLELILVRIVENISSRKREIGVVKQQRTF